MELFGAEYIAQHCIQELRRRAEERQLITYITDGLYACSGNGKLTRRYAELIAETKTDGRTEAEVISDIKSKFEKAGGST